jgi:dipeptidyl aminopeptidase/acylaminoacyl peptidase
MRTKLHSLIVLLGLPLLLPVPASADEPLQTVAEKSNFKATARHAEVVQFCERLAKLSPLVRLGELGTSSEGRKLPLIILADPPVATPAEAARSGKLVVYAQGNIHAGEVDAKEALLMLARDLATAPEHPLLKDLIIVIAPIFNADGNERMAKTNRPGQKGPEEGMGIRANAQGFDLNRDFVKLESPEARALVRFCNRWDPAIVIDGHTTNGSHHRYTITYEGPRVPAGDANVIAFTQDKLFPDVTRRLDKYGYKSFYYGNFSRDRTLWETVPPTPRYGTLYVGLRNRIGILSESYSYASYRDRILATRDFVRSILEYAAAHKDEIRRTLADARAATIRAGREPRPDDRVALRSRVAPLGGDVQLLGFVEEVKDGRRTATDKPQEYRVRYMGRSEPTYAVRRPYAYLFPPIYAKVVENLQRHGVEVEELREDIDLDVEVYRITKLVKENRTFQKHQAVSTEAESRGEARRVTAGSILVRTGQALGDLVVYLLEPQSEDGLVTWNYFDEALAEGKDFPVLRLPHPTPLTASPVRPLAEDRTFNKMVTFEALYGSGQEPEVRGRRGEGRGQRAGGRGQRGRQGGRQQEPPNFAGSPVSGITWLEDGEHFLQVKDGRLYKVHARSGRAQPFHDPDKLAAGLGSLPTIPRATARMLAGGTSFHMNPQRTGALFEHDNDIYYCNFDGTHAVRLTRTPGAEELPEFSPDGRFVSFVRDNNLYVVDIATQTERALTSDGGPLVLNGKPDWVYLEEVFNRRASGSWWSPDSQRIAFIRYDDHPVPTFTVLDHIPLHQTVESIPYPKSGDPNPIVKLGVVSVAGGPVHWADLSNYSETGSIIDRAGWTPDGRTLTFYVQDRAQTWLDFCTAPAAGGSTTRLFRETTKAWVDNPGPPTYLADGSFVLPSERTGWKHLYHFDRTGHLRDTITSGAWEARALQRVDETGGWVYFTGTRDSPIAENLYRVHFDGSGLERLTPEPGDHQVSVSPKANLYIDTHGSHAIPTQVHLRSADGKPVRTLDTNPIYVLEEYRLGHFELVQIPLPDGFVLEGSLLTPPDFDPSRRYPVWFMTYGGPHAPTIRDNWYSGRGGLAHDQMLAALGFVVFHCDPRSASGKGVCSAWTAYRRLGVGELKDIEAAIGWLTKHSSVDADRIGMSGHSYGGFMTSFALTHSKLFAAGIAGAPVTDWRYYDSIYTERYMNTPQENPEGYDLTSVVKAAGNLHGKLLIAHGIMDDNVHLQNTVELMEALQRAGKDFQVMFYPRSRHGIVSPHYRRLHLDFMLRALGVGPEPTAPPRAPDVAPRTAP